MGYDISVLYFNGYIGRFVTGNLKIQPTCYNPTSLDELEVNKYKLA